MSGNVRFYALIAFFAVLIGSLWWFLGGDDSGNSVVPPDTVKGPVAPAGKAGANDPESPVRPDVGTGNGATGGALFSSIPGTARSTRTAKPVAPKRQRTGDGVIRGRVLDGAGRAVTGATVTVIAEDAEGALGQSAIVYHDAVQTDREGRYEVANVPFGKSYYQLKATTPTMFSVLRAYLSEANPEVELNFTLVEGGAIEGWVRDEAGEPVVGASLYPSQKLGQGEPLSEERRRNLRSATDAEGHFTLNLDAGSWRLFVKAQGYATLETPLLAVGTQDAAIVLTRGGSVSGNVVLDKTGEPLADVPVLIQSKSYSENKYRTTTDAEGKFLVEGLQDGEYTLNISHKLYIPARGPLGFTVADGKQTTGISLQATKGGIDARRL